MAALSGVGGPTLNCVYATLAGDVGYQMCGGPVPLRASGDGRFPTAEPWIGTVPYEELPAWRNPADGTIVTANNRIVPDDYPAPDRDGVAEPVPARSGSPTCSRQRDRHAPADLARIQTDVYSLPLARLRDLVRDHEAPTRSSAARSACSRAGTARWPPRRRVRPSPRRCCGT